MPQDAFTIKHTVKELNGVIKNARIERINQPSKDTLTFFLRCNNVNKKLVICANADYARICLTDDETPAPISAPSFCMLLRKHLSRATINGVSVVENERIAFVDLTCRDELGTPSEKRLYCEIMGKYSNVTLVENGIVLGALKTTGMNETLSRPIYSGAKYTLPKSQDKCPVTDETAAYKALEKLEEGTDAARFLSDNFSGISYQTAMDVVEKYVDASKPVLKDVKIFKTKEFIKYFNDYYETPDIKPTLVSDGKKSDFYIVGPSLEYKEKRSFKSINELVDAYYLRKENAFKFNLKKQRLSDSVAAYEKKIRKNIKTAEEKVLSCKDMDKLRLYGELIISNLFRLKSGEFAEVENYYEEGSPVIKIALDKNLTPKENAERFFKKYNKQKKTVAASLPIIEKLNGELTYIDSLYAEIAQAETDDDFSDIEEELISYGIFRKKTDKTRKNKKLSPFRRFTVNGFEILVGRNNVQNDRLTLSADRNDIWLHTKNFHSSHVIIKTEGRIVPDEVLLKAAQICAYYSNAKDSLKIPVDYTLKKYVKKPSGTACGKVFYTDQKTLIVDPKLPT